MTSTILVLFLNVQLENWRKLEIESCIIISRMITCCYDQLNIIKQIVLKGARRPSPVDLEPDNRKKSA